MPNFLIIVALLFAVLGLAFFIAGIVALKKKRLLGTGVSLLLTLLMLSLAALSATISVATQGYRALTREEVAAVVKTEPMDPVASRPSFIFPTAGWPFSA